jgi:hypothetical protein
MATSHESGPCIIYGQAGGEANESLGPSLSWGGGALLDPRVGYQPGQGITVPALGWADNFFPVINQVPSALAAANIAAAQVPVAGTPLTLVPATGAGITVGQQVVNLNTGLPVTGLLVIDGLPTPISFGQQGPVQIYDPRNAIARNLRITSAGNDSTATATARGYDIYGAPMSETITLANIGIASGKKAFKFIASVIPAGTLSGANVSVGTGDVYGIPVRVDEWQFVDIYFGAPPAAFITAATGWLAADTTNPATATTGDVRGTYATQSASDGTKKLAVFASVVPWNLAPVAAAGNTYAGIFGMPQA